ncbi:MAG: haloacid dehalogenase type II [Gemmatimonadales bacterium]
MTRDINAVKVCAFDMFGTLFDVHSVVQACRDAFGPEGNEFSVVWRRIQLEYSWMRALMERWVPFWQVTCDSLDTTLEVYGRGDDGGLRDRLLGAYKKVSPYPDSGPALEALGEAGVRCVILTNGSRDMVNSALDAAGFKDRFEGVFTVDDIEIFKPSPRVYAMARDGLKLEPEEILMVSSHPWDLAGAISYGFQGVWIDRPGTGHHLEHLGFDPDHRVHTLTGLVKLVSGSAS